MNTYDFTFEDVARAALALADENPDAVYHKPNLRMCGYSYGEAAGNVGCLFGQAFRNLGVSEDDLAELDKNSPNVGVAMRRLVSDVAPDAPDALEEALINTQGEQDLGYPWGDAVTLGNLREMLA